MPPHAPDKSSSDPYRALLRRTQYLEFQNETACPVECSLVLFQDVRWQNSDNLTVRRLQCKRNSRFIAPPAGA